MNSALTSRSGNFSEEQTVSAAREMHASLGGTAHAALAFCSPDYIPHLQDFCEILRVHGHAIHVAGCTGSGFIEADLEHEFEPGFSVLAISADEASLPVFEISDSDPLPHSERKLPVMNGWVTLINPLLMDAEDWLAEWNVPFPGVPVIGGMASGGTSADDIAVFLDGKVVPGVVLGVGGKIRLIPVVSPGCRPIGEPLTVTRAENNVVYSLGARPAYEALESAFETLSDKEKAGARGNLFAGLAGTEYVEDFRPADFLVRNILGADPSSGAVVIGGIPRVGQTLQYQLRDATTADLDLQSTLKNASAEWGRPFASLVFACNGRGKALFGGPGHDSGSIQNLLGPHPSAGFFCSGEIGPVGLKNCVHSYSLCSALLAQGGPLP